MTKKQGAEQTYTELLAELESVIQWFQSSQLDVDQALQRYNDGMKLVAALEEKLRVAKAAIEVSRQDVVVE